MDFQSPDDLNGRVQRMLTEVFQVDMELITPDLSFGDLPQWDSLGHMDVMMRLEEQFGAEIDTDAIASLVNVPAICRFLQERGYA